MTRPLVPDPTEVRWHARNMRKHADASTDAFSALANARTPDRSDQAYERLLGTLGSLLEALTLASEAYELPLETPDQFQLILDVEVITCPT